MKNDRYNNEGYADPTAYHAIKSADKPNPGELWNIEQANGIQKQCVVLSCGNNTAVVLHLVEENRETCDISLNCRGMMYADSNMLQYTWYNRFVSYIRTLNAAEFEEVKETIADTLDISRIETVKIEKVVETVEVEKEPEKVQNEDYSGCVLKLERTEAQLEIYKDLYRELLEKLTA